MRRAFTLTEVMLAVFIFTVLAAAMLGVFNAASRLYQQGERSLAAADQAAALLQLLRRDAEQAVGEQAGGDFYTWTADDGSSVVGWSMRLTPSQFADLQRTYDLDSPLYQAFVIWWRNDADELHRLLLPWPLVATDPLRQVLVDPDPSLDPRSELALETTSRLLTRDCLHFGAWLSGITIDDERGLVPALSSDLGFDGPPQDIWQWLSNGTEPLADPITQTRRYSTLNAAPLPMPDTVRFDLILSGDADDAGGRLSRILKEEDSHIAVRGLQGFIPSQGSLLRVGVDPESWEWIGVHAAERDGFRINDHPRQGPVAILGEGVASGRGVLRSLLPADEQHPIGSRVQSGRRFHLTHRFGR
ncbi:MAG: PulJ/GspJ family protein [Planctomycetota bacterium]